MPLRLRVIATVAVAVIVHPIVVLVPDFTAYDNFPINCASGRKTTLYVLFGNVLFHVIGMSTVAPMPRIEMTFTATDFPSRNELTPAGP